MQDAGFTVVKSDPRDTQALSLLQLQKKATIIHICAPLHAVSLGLDESSDHIIVLHDSVMDTSHRWNRTHLQGKGNIVHFLMNSEKTIIIAKQSPHKALLSAHFTDLGFHPVILTIKQHDELMARTQAPLALLSKTLAPFIEETFAQGLLTDSGKSLREVLHSRQTKWTEATIESILRNPQLKGLLKDMVKNTINNRGRV